MKVNLDLRQFLTFKFTYIFWRNQPTETATSKSPLLAVKKPVAPKKCLMYRQDRQCCGFSTHAAAAACIDF